MDQRVGRPITPEPGLWLVKPGQGPFLHCQIRLAILVSSCPTLVAEPKHNYYLTKLRLSKNVKGLVKKLFHSGGREDAGQGWESLEDTLTLQGWSRARRVVVLRRKLTGEMLLTGKDDRQDELAFIEGSVPTARYEYAVLVTSTQYEILTLAQLYRDRADAENNFDELKNQWGWGGFTTRDLARCRLMARMVALVYNWWTLFVRLAQPHKHFEAISTNLCDA